MAGKTNTKQICVFKTGKALLEFMDDTRYEKQAMAWPHSAMSRIRINAKDYSKGTGDLAIDAFYNLSPDEFYRLQASVMRVKAVTAQDVARCTHHIERLEKARQGVSSSAEQSQIVGIEELMDLASQFAGSSNEVFSEAGNKLLNAIKNVTVSNKTSKNGSIEALLEEANAELDNAKATREIFSDIKILNYDKYCNPDNDEERRVTMIKVIYIPQRNYPYVFTVSNGWAVPKITKINGVMIKEGSTHFSETVSIAMDEKTLYPMLKRVDTFLQAMTYHGLTSYFEGVSNPILFYNMDNADD